MHNPKCDVVRFAFLPKDLDDLLEQLTIGAAAEKTISKQPKVQAIEVKQLGRGLRIADTKPIIRMICTTELVIDGTKVGFLLSNSSLDSKCLAARCDAMR